VLGCRGIFQRKWGEKPPLSRNCNWEDSIKTATGQPGRLMEKAPISQETLVYALPLEAAASYEAAIFSSSEDRALRKCLFILFFI